MCIYMEKNSEKNLVCGENGKYEVCVNHTSENQTTLAAFSVIGKFTYIIFCKYAILSQNSLHLCTFSAKFSEQKSIAVLHIILLKSTSIQLMFMQKSISFHFCFRNLLLVKQLSLSLNKGSPLPLFFVRLGQTLTDFFRLILLGQVYHCLCSPLDIPDICHCFYTDTF